MGKIKMFKTDSLFCFWDFEFSSFSEFVSNFVLRISDLLNYTSLYTHHLCELVSLLQPPKSHSHGHGKFRPSLP